MISSKSFRVALLVLAGITTAFAASSQNFDTIVLKKSDAIKVLSKGLQAKELENQRDLLLMEVDTLKSRIVIKEMMVTNLNGQISDYKNIKASQEEIIKQMQDQKKILQDQIFALNKSIKRQKRKTRWVSFGGVVVSGLLGYLYFTK